MTPGGNITCNSETYLYNKYKPGAGVGASSVASRRAKLRLATACSRSQTCGKFYSELGQNQIRPSQFTTYNSNFTY
jgi:hypothetical protein